MLKVPVNKSLKWWAVVFLSMVAGFAIVSIQVIGSPLVPVAFSPALSVALLLLSFWGFVVSGKKVITPFSMVFLSFAVNLGFPAVYTSFFGKHGDYEISTVTALLALILALMIAARNKKEKDALSIDFRYLHRLSFRFVSISLLSLYLMFFVLYKYDPVFTLFWRSALGLFPTLFAFFAWKSVENKKYSTFLFLSFFCVFSALLYAFFVFSVGGRINVVAVPLAVVILLSMVYPSNIYKAALILFFPLGLVLAGYHRVMQRESLYTGSETYAFEAGLGSVLAPFKTLVEIVERSQFFGIQPALEWLNQMIFSFLFWIPRVFWADKPEGFGRLMVYELRPWMSHTNHSMAASLYGEFIYYMGFLGPLVGTLFLIFLSRIYIYFKILIPKQPAIVQPYLLALYAYMLAQLLTLIWGGVAGYSVRAFAAAFGMAIVLIACWGLSKLPRKPRFSV